MVCQTCVDVCDARALRYDMRGGGAGEVRLNQDACTGCGDCLPVCPVGAIALQGGDMPETYHISSLLVRAHPDRLADVKAAIEQIESAEIAATDPTGKIIVTLETPGDAEIVAALNRVETLAGVASAALVFHHIETDGADSPSHAGDPAGFTRETDHDRFTP